MSSANVELVRSILASWQRGDYHAAAWADPEIEFVMVDGPAPGVWTGLAGMAEGFRDWLSAWEDFRVEAEDFFEIDSERVLVLAHYSGRGRTSGVEIGEMHARGAGVHHIRNGKVTRHLVYWDRERAFTDLGFAPGAGPTP